ncbi:MAG: aldehyde dehydrogenase family protein, partial [Geothrix sp.]|nr:aldehyde dehydrogenase family protein [Geothrix sp.]
RVKGNIGHGVYMQPCVWDGVRPEMGLFRNQVPGPSVNLSTFKDIEEPLAWLHGAACGPILRLHTQDPVAIGRFRRETRADTISINARAEQPGTCTPYTGQGTHPGGRLALEGFTRWQASNGAGLADLEPGESAVGLPPVSIQTDWDSL